MKYLVLIFIFLPTLLFAQTADEIEKPKTQKNEILLAHGLRKYTGFSTSDIMPADFLFMLGYMRNGDRSQYGIRVEGGFESNIYYYVSPVLLYNRKKAIKKSYLYAGVAAGYHQHDSYGRWAWTQRSMRGYVLGAQFGASVNMGKRLSFNAEVGIRSAQLWYPEYYDLWSPHGEIFDIKYIERDFMLHIPVTVGFKYKF